MKQTRFYAIRRPTPVGGMLLASDGQSLVGAWIEGQKYFCRAVGGNLEDGTRLGVLKTAEEWLAAYFAGEKPEPEALPLAPAGSEFAQSVWRLLRAIPYGKTTTYGEIAKEIASQRNLPSMASRAVGGAVSHNPLSIIVPCHRVIRAGGKLGGYAAGPEVKLKLLALERVDTSRFSASKNPRAAGEAS